MEKSRSEELIKKYVKGEISPEERALVENWFLRDLIDSDYIPDENRISGADENISARLSAILQDSHSEQKPIYHRSRFAIAASIFLALFICGYALLLNLPQNSSEHFTKETDIPPGSSKAILTLSDGRKIVLSEGFSKNLLEQPGAEITKDSSGVISYHFQDSHKEGPTVYNTLSTPRGGTYKLVMGDGTIVYLNAMSSITFPTSFASKRREVSITGELFFEVAHQPSKPFVVSSRGQSVEVLGTHFNINSYTDEQAVKTTLFEGKVRVSHNKQTIYLKPGQQSQLASTLELIQHPDSEEAIAWKNGFFHFNNTDLQTVMRILSRWYDVDIEYRGKPTKRRFTGDIHKNVNVSKALQIISYLGVDFSVEGRKIIVNQ